MPVNTVEFTMTCPRCRRSVTVNDLMRSTLLEEGCVFCDASLTTDAFSKTGRTTR